MIMFKISTRTCSPKVRSFHSSYHGFGCSCSYSYSYSNLYSYYFSYSQVQLKQISTWKKCNDNEDEVNKCSNRNKATLTQSSSQSSSQSPSQSSSQPFTEQSMELIKQLSDEIRSSVRLYTSQNPNLTLIGISSSRSNLQSYIHHNHHQQSQSQSQPQPKYPPEINYSINTSIESYSDSISKTCKEDNIQYQLWRLAGGYNITHQLSHMLHRANTLHNVHGILLYYPLISNKPQVLGWDHDRNWSVEREQEQINNSINTSTNNTTTRTYILERNRKRLPGLSYKTRDDFYRSIISYQRDVEGLCPMYHSRSIFRNAHIYVDDNNRTSCINTGTDTGTTSSQQMIFPCTALAVVKILQRIVNSYNPNQIIGTRWKGTIVTIINRSEILGRPLASLLANDGAIVYSVDEDSIIMYSYRKMRRIHSSPSHSPHSHTWCNDADEMNVESCVKKSNVIVTAVPSSTFKIPTSWIQPGSKVINVASEPNIDEEELSHVPDVTYIPQIGKVTVALLEQNLVTLHKLYHRNN